MWEEYRGKASADYDDEEITFVSTKIGTSIEGTVNGIGNRKKSQFDDGEQRTYFYTGDDGVKYGLTARKAVLERFDEARPEKGDRIKLTVEAAISKSTGRKYGAPTLLVDRASGETASQAAELPDEPSKAMAADEVPF